MSSFDHITPVPDHVPFEDRAVHHHGLTLRYRLWGDRSKPLLLLQHGGKDHKRNWDWTVAALVEDYCCATPDLRGHGDSDWVPGGGYEAFDLVTDMAVIVEDLIAQGFKAPIPIIGHSLGGNVALYYTASQPERVSRLIVMEGLGFSQESYDSLLKTPAAERWQKAVGRRLTTLDRDVRHFADPEEGVARMASLHKQLRADQARHLALHALRKEPEGYCWKHDPLLTFQSLRPVPPTEYKQLYATIQCPVLLMYGLKSWATSPKEDGRLSAFQKARLIEYEGAGHWLHHDRLDDFVQDCRQFLAENDL